MFSKARKTLQFLFYAVLTSYAPYDFRTIPPENTIIFVPDVICRRDRRSQSARSYFSSVAQHCPYGAGEAVVKKIELMRSSRIPNHEFLLFYVKDHRNIYASGRLPVASASAEEYSDRSYPYARVIYNIILESQTGNLKYTKGKAPLEDIATSKQLTQTYIEKWREFQVDIEERIKVREDPMRRMEEAKRQTEACQREIERMKQELEVLREESAELTRK
ncbi:hypothetical protein ARMSODRAFT_1003287 [Armillaria solidipes]|uniref:Uncharacterized protein n=1 Tax=Armillaria solidipes TaxID=1076256 RepID=A0A2H3C3G2_9AGAR|nr:hypothetical protein ARMSODRAFT_1003287 [Armillaria solidipes]